MEELEKVTANARQAVLMADEATRKGDATKAAEYARTAETFANRLIAVEAEVESLKQMQLQTTEAANQAKSAVTQNSMALQKKLSEKQRLLCQLDQAKIEARHAKAMGMSELTGSSVEAKMLEVEQAAMGVEAQARLSQIRSQLGLDAAPVAEVAPAAEAAQATEPPQATPGT